MFGFFKKNNNNNNNTQRPPQRHIIEDDDDDYVEVSNNPIDEDMDWEEVRTKSPEPLITSSQPKEQITHQITQDKEVQIPSQAPAPIEQTVVASKPQAEPITLPPTSNPDTYVVENKEPNWVEELKSQDKNTYTSSVSITPHYIASTGTSHIGRFKIYSRLHYVLLERVPYSTNSEAGKAYSSPLEGHEYISPQSNSPPYISHVPVPPVKEVGAQTPYLVAYLYS